MNGRNFGEKVERLHNQPQLRSRSELDLKVRELTSICPCSFPFFLALSGHLNLVGNFPAGLTTLFDAALGEMLIDIDLGASSRFGLIADVGIPIPIRISASKTAVESPCDFENEIRQFLSDLLVEVV